MLKTLEKIVHYHLFALVLLGFSSTVQSAWDFNPSAELSVSTDDNARLTPSSADAIVLGKLTAQGHLRNVSETHTISALIGGTLNEYDNADDRFEDKKNLFTTLRANRVLSFGTVGLQASAKRDDLTRSATVIRTGDGSEFLDELIEDVEADDVDVASTREQAERTRYRLSPNVSFRTSALGTLQLSASHDRTRYDRIGRLIGLRDRESDGVEATFTQRVNPTNSFNATTRASRFTSEGSADVDAFEGRLGWSRDLSELTSVLLEVGARRSEPDIGESETGFVYRLRGTRKLETGRIALSAERSLMPDPYGNVVDADRVSALWNRRFSPRMNVSVSLRGYRTRFEGRGAGVTGRDRDYAEVRTRLRWRMNEDWSISANYSYRWLDRKILQDSAASNDFSLTLSYTPPSEL